IDDKAVSAFSDLQKELGYYQIDTKSRSFNKVIMEKDFVVKISDLKNIEGEIYWYLSIPKDISDLFPKLIEHGKYQDEYYYKIEKVEGVTLSNLFINNKLTIDIFKDL